jgi:hypothetical protein
MHRTIANRRKLADSLGKTLPAALTSRNRHA